MRRLVSTSIVALALMLATAVPSAFANGTTQNTKFRATLAELATSVHQGQKLQGLITLENLTANRQHADIQVSIVTPLGTAQIATLSRDVAENFHKSVRKSFDVAEDARPGQYELVVTVLSGNDAPLVLRHDFTVSK